MPDIVHDFPIAASIERVFGVLVSPEGLDAWWTRNAEGTPRLGADYRFIFSPEYEWTGVMRRYQPPTIVEWEMTRADADWTGTKVGFRLAGQGTGTQVAFYHTGWPAANDHYRTSCYCWAMYLRILKRYLEHGEMVEYEARLEV
jgi:uncharacterized protein YndB with AHSA1/START domain